jgi:hypothetical protein
MAQRRTTFGKMQRERDKKAKLHAKQERRAARAEQAQDEAPARPEPTRDEGETLAALAALHEAFEDGQLSLEEFEIRRDRLRAELAIS